MTGHITPDCSSYSAPDATVYNQRKPVNFHHKLIAHAGVTFVVRKYQKTIDQKLLHSLAIMFPNSRCFNCFFCRNEIKDLCRNYDVTVEPSRLKFNVFWSVLCTLCFCGHLTRFHGTAITANQQKSVSIHQCT